MEGINRNSDTWLAVVKWAEDQLKNHREYLEFVNVAHDESQILRGRIDELKELLDLPND